MSSRVGFFIGMVLADVRHFFRGRQAVPCLVEWDEAAGADFDFTAYLADADDDGCADCEGNCCLATDTIGEFRGR